jgi:hypothetical protein
LIDRVDAAIAVGQAAELLNDGEMEAVK